MFALDLRLKDISEDGEHLRVPIPGDVIREATGDADLGRSQVTAELDLLNITAIACKNYDEATGLSIMYQARGDQSRRSAV